MVATLDFDDAVRVLRGGGVVAIPTDTVYGLAASLAHPDAVARLFTLKQRPSSVALPVLVGERADVSALGVTLSPSATRLADRFWPGALTLVVSAPATLARLVGSTTSSVGLRLPDDEVTRALLRACGPLAVSSANRHGEPPCTNAEAVRASLDSSDLDGVLDAGERSGAVSTVVVEEAARWRVARAGATSPSEIERALG